MPAAPIKIGLVPSPLLKGTGLVLIRTLVDSTRTGEIVVAEEILTQAQLQYWGRSGLFEESEASDLLADHAESSAVESQSKPG
jgi:hypothetical protein